MLHAVQCIAPDHVTSLMQAARTHSTIGLGFFAIATLFFAIMAIFLTMVSSNNANLRQLDRGESQRELVFAMRDAAHQRNLALFRMVALNDVFARDSEYLRFKESAGQFIAARQLLLDDYLDADTAEHWQDLKPLIQRSEKLQNAIVTLIMEDNNPAALSLIQQEFIPAQRRVSQQLSNMLEAAQGDIAAQLDSASAATQTHYQVILLLVLVATSIGYLIAKAVLRRSDEAQNILLRKNEQIRAINTAISKPHTAIEEQVDIILRLGCEFLSMEYGVLVERETNAPATWLNCYPPDQQAEFFKKPALLDYVTDSMQAEGLLEVSGEMQSPLGEMLREVGIAHMMASTLTTSASSSHLVIFTNSKTTPPSSDALELLELLSNKLSVLLDQQETLSQLQAAKLAAETANKTKTVFLANITDELRTPLDHIVDHNESLRDKLPEDQHPECAADLDTIYQSSQKLNTLISNLLDMTQLESDNLVLELQEVDIEPSLRHIQTELEPVIHQRGDHFEMTILNPLGMMHSDADRIRQVLVNLLNFSGKASQPGDINLTAWREPCPEGDWLYLEVKNTANGISKKQLNQLFKLSSVNSTEQDKKAIGQEIQLAISKKICELLGGDILAESNPHQGTIFTVCLPCHFQQQTHPVSASA